MKDDHKKDDREEFSGRENLMLERQAEETEAMAKIVGLKKDQAENATSILTTALENMTRGAVEDIGQIADVPYSTSTSNLGRDVMTRIYEYEAKVEELNQDINASGQRRDELVAHANRLIDLANNQHQQEIAVLRGRETDLMRTLGVLRQASAALKV